MPQVKLHASKFEELILRRGRKVLWQEAVMCSCSNNGHPLYDCKACMGVGYTLAQPIEDVVLLQSVTSSKDFEAQAGMFELGDAVMTVGAYVPEANPVTGNLNRTSKGRKNLLFHVGQGDIITLTDDEYKTSEVLIKGTPIFGRQADTLLNEEVLEILRIQKSDPVTGAISVYARGTDFTFNKNIINWSGVNKPADGENYTVVYTHRPSFTVFTQLPTPRYQDGQDLPKKVALRYRAGGIDRR
jgi:hypothetical protein